MAVHVFCESDLLLINLLSLDW